MPKGQRRKTQTTIQRLVVILLVSLSFATIALDVFLDTTYSETRPNSSKPEEGRIYAQHVRHGTLVYLTETEKLAYQFAPAVAVVLFGAGVILHRRWSGSPL
jgi:hypothetical protein